MDCTHDAAERHTRARAEVELVDVYFNTSGMGIPWLTCTEFKVTKPCAPHDGVAVACISNQTSRTLLSQAQRVEADLSLASSSTSGAGMLQCGQKYQSVTDTAPRWLPVCGPAAHCTAQPPALPHGWLARVDCLLRDAGGEAVGVRRVGACHRSPRSAGRL